MDNVKKKKTKVEPGKDGKTEMIMTLIEYIAEAKTARVLAEKALDMATEAKAEVESMKRTTHSVYTLDPNSGVREDPIGERTVSLEEDILNSQFEEAAGIDGVDLTEFDPAMMAHAPLPDKKDNLPKKDA